MSQPPDAEGQPPVDRIARYDLLTFYRCGSAIEEMTRADDGEWVRYADVESQLADLQRQLSAAEAERDKWKAAAEQMDRVNDGAQAAFNVLMDEREASPSDQHGGSW